MEKISVRKSIILLMHSFVIWAFCGAVMGIGMANTTLRNALTIHAIAAPLITATVSSIYFKNFYYTSPIQTAIVNTGFVMLTDLFLVALLINKSLNMFTSFVGTWLPFMLIFVSTYLTGSMWRTYKNKVIEKNRAK